MRKQKREKGERYQSLKVRLIDLLGDRADVARIEAARILGVSTAHLDSVMTALRKAGIRIWAAKGPGTALKIVSTQRDAERYLDHRDAIYLGVARGMIETAADYGEQYKELSARPQIILKQLNGASRQK